MAKPLITLKDGIARFTINAGQPTNIIDTMEYIQTLIQFLNSAEIGQLNNPVLLFNIPKGKCKALITHAAFPADAPSGAKMKRMFKGEPA